MKRLREAGRRLPPSLALVGFAVLWRVGSAALAFLLNVVFPDYQREQFTVFGSTNLFWDTFARYDSGWYFQIARFGFHYTPGGRDTIAFFPVYPLLMRHVGRLFGAAPSDLYLGGIAVSWVAFAVAVVGLYKLAHIETASDRVARRTVLFTAIFPFAFFFGMVYTEATFLASTVWTFYFFRTRQWVAGGIVGAVASATRVNGILMWPALAWIVWRQAWTEKSQEGPGGQAGHGERERRVGLRGPRGRDRLLSVVGLVLVAAGIGSYSLFVYQLSGNPFEWAATIQRWGYYPGGAPWLALWRLAHALVTHPMAYFAGSRMAPYDTLNGLAGLGLVVATPIVWRRLGAAYGLFLAVNLWLPLSSGQYEGLGRYCSVLFPFFLLLARTRSHTCRTAIVVSFAMLYVVCFALFVNIHPLF